MLLRPLWEEQPACFRGRGNEEQRPHSLLVRLLVSWLVGWLVGPMEGQALFST